MNELESTKRCSRCPDAGRPVMQPLSAFGKNRGNKDGRTHLCRLCLNDLARGRRKTPASQLKHEIITILKEHLGLTQPSFEQTLTAPAEDAPRVRTDQYKVLFAQQHGRCACCREPETTKDIDGQILPLTIYFSSGSRRANIPGVLRGLICRDCFNMFLAAKDSPQRLALGIAFLTNDPMRSKLYTGRARVHSALPAPEEHSNKQVS